MLKAAPAGTAVRGYLVMQAGKPKLGYSYSSASYVLLVLGDGLSLLWCPVGCLAGVYLG